MAIRYLDNTAAAPSPSSGRIRYLDEQPSPQAAPNQPESFGQRALRVGDTIGNFFQVQNLPRAVAQIYGSDESVKQSRAMSDQRSEMNTKLINRAKQAKASGNTASYERLMKTVRANNETLPTAESLATGGEGYVTNKQVVGSALNLANLATLGAAIPASLGGRVAVGAGIGATGGAGTAMNQNASAGDIAKSATFGGAVGGAVPLVIAGASTARQKISDYLSNKGKDVALKAIRPSPSQIKNFRKETKTDLVEFVNKHKLYSNDLNHIDQKIEPVQQAFDDIAINSDVRVSPTTLQQAFRDKIDELAHSTAPSARTKAEQLRKVAENFDEVYGGKASGKAMDIVRKKNLSVGELTAERKDFDELVRKFKLDPALADVNETTRNVLQDVIRKSTKHLSSPDGRSLEDLGSELQKFYAFKKIAEQQSGLGKGSGLLGIRTLIGAGLGAGSTYGGENSDPWAYLRNAAIGGLVGTAANSPQAAALASKSLSKAGRVTSKQLPKSVAALLEKLIAAKSGQTTGSSTSRRSNSR